MCRFRLDDTGLGALRARSSATFVRVCTADEVRSRHAVASVAAMEEARPELQRPHHFTHGRDRACIGLDLQHRLFESIKPVLLGIQLAVQFTIYVASISSCAAEHTAAAHVSYAADEPGASCPGCTPRALLASATKAAPSTVRTAIYKCCLSAAVAPLEFSTSGGKDCTARTTLGSRTAIYCEPQGDTTASGGARTVLAHARSWHRWW